ncbi:hypothetical protein HDV02_003982 [Globomyces sp. JEL0801]|nr:hypothetical protein HDV02_003982 [Globomyces sp. JEL0801]
MVELLLNKVTDLEEEWEKPCYKVLDTPTLKTQSIPETRAPGSKLGSNPNSGPAHHADLQNKSNENGTAAWHSVKKKKIATIGTQIIAGIITIVGPSYLKAVPIGFGWTLGVLGISSQLLCTLALKLIK